LQTVSYVEYFDHNPNYEIPSLYPPIYLLHKDARAALSNLRLVDKTFSRSASRALFGGVRARLGYGVSSISKLETLSSSAFAKYVHFIHFEIVDMDPFEFVREENDEGSLQEDEYEDFESQEEVVNEGGIFRLSDKAVNHLSSLIAEFRNLKAFSVWPEEFIPLEKAIGFLTQIIITIADLQLRGFIHRVTDLRTAVDGATQMTNLLETGGPQTVIRHFLRNIQHLTFIGSIGIDVDMGDIAMEPIDLDTLIKASPNLLSFTMLGSSALHP
jgi:hypothetical protein